MCSILFVPWNTRVWTQRRALGIPNRRLWLSRLVGILSALVGSPDALRRFRRYVLGKPASTSQNRVENFIQFADFAANIGN